MLEKRQIERHRTLKGARIVLPNSMGSTFECVVRNLSSRGANLEIASTLGIPDHFQIVFDDGSEGRSCTVVWRTERKLGVQFGALP